MRGRSGCRKLTLVCLRPTFAVSGDMAAAGSGSGKRGGRVKQGSARRHFCAKYDGLEDFCVGERI